MKFALPLSLLLCLMACQPKTTYEIVLKNGTIYDGSGEEPFLGDVGINADTIAVIAEPNTLSGKETIYVEGRAVAPGFINMLSWANVSLLEDGRAQEAS